jgi:hypothetical protein
MAKKKVFPETLSGLLRLAVADARKCAADKRFDLNMSNWVLKYKGARCEVCMAGAVMVKTLRLRPLGAGWTNALVLEPGNCGENGRAMYAINAMRKGDFYGAAGYLNVAVISHALGKAGRLVSRAFKNTRLVGRAPWNAYLRAAAILEAAGL